ncbi:MAG: Mobile element protein [Candidatus Carbobacillus altaicus]|uniref:Mobile element protein n=1 Tax=Candidatus Carbonibacillus altaicus TaxID=2163959 RepID=A0A2R6XYI2_9BACL|nr:MAG: Mobile element protein [Candidatus Carbobacillus altaicus]
MTVNRKPECFEIDASPYAWLEDRGGELTLHGIIDDATGMVVGALFRPTETREGYFSAMNEAIQQYGIPLGIYSDRHTIFRSPKETLTLEQELAGQTATDVRRFPIINKSRPEYMTFSQNS